MKSLNLSFLRITFCLILNLIAHTAYSQDKVVVIPMFGDDAATKWRGEWVTNTLYSEGDIIEFDGSSYIAITKHDSDLGNIPPDEQFWNLVASSGASGPQGEVGPPGPQLGIVIYGYYIAYAEFPGWSGNEEIISTEAHCEEGDIATGGGYGLSATSTLALPGNEPILRMLEPIIELNPNGDEPVGWRVEASNIGPGYAVLARATCADLTP